MRDETIEMRINELNEYAARVIEQVNSVHQSGVGLGGTPGVAFFSGTDASNLRVNAEVVDDPAKVATARLYWDVNTSSYTSADGDASNAIAIAQLQGTLIQRDTAFAATIAPGTTMTTAGAVGLTVGGLDVSKAAAGSTYVLSTVGSVVSISRNGAPAVAMTAELNPDGKTFILSNTDLGIRISISAASAETMAGVAPTLNGLTFATAVTSTTLNDQYSAQIAALGVESQAAQNDSVNQDVLVNHLTRRREETSGVSLDEEATNLLKFQHAYEAAARVMTVVDDMLDKLINGTGRAGR
jgi:flagellar hook-associated protein 1 FlgK